MSPRQIARYALVVPLLALAINAQNDFLGQKTIKGVGTECTDRQFRVAFQLPPKWNVTRQNRWVDDQEPASTILLREPGQDTFIGLYYRLFRQPLSLSNDEIDKALLAHADAKISQRVREGLKNYHIRHGSYETIQLGSRRGLHWIADYTEGKRAMVEYMTFVQSGRALALLFTHTRAEDLESFRQRLEPLIQSLDTP